MQHIACNLIYNNGDEGTFVGFRKRCSIQNIIYNIESVGDKWCKQPACSCRSFYNRNFRGNVEEFPCNESSLFESWTWNPGNEFATGNRFHIKNSGAGKIAILTTRFANTDEKERKIVGFLKIRSIVDEYQVNALKKQSLRLTLEEAQELNFWNYHKNKKSTKILWNSGRFRYLEDNQVAAILHDLKCVVQNDSTKSMISNILENDFAVFPTRPIVNSALENTTVKKILLKRKYGKGGESNQHKQLKQYIASNPHIIGLDPQFVNPIIEHSYLSGDLVDILFEPVKGKENTVVEIELDIVKPGIHQAIKYRALRCSQLGVSLKSPNIKATIVAWSFTEDEKRLCNKYNIKYVECRI
jgi:hypothetical protein